MAKDAAVSDISDVSADKSEQVATQGGEDVDFEAILKAHEAELETTKGALSKTTQEFEGLKGEHSKYKETVDKMRSVFVPEREVSDYDKEMELLDAKEQEWYAKALDYERRGKPIDLTVTNGLDNIKYRREYLQQMKALKEENAELKKKVEVAADPRNAVAEMVYNHLDSEIERHITQIFGEADSTEMVRKNQFNAVQNAIGEELKYRRENDPKTYNQIMKDKRSQDKLVAYYVQQNIPPKARQLLEEDRIRKEPVPLSELINAFREAKKNGNKAEASQLRTQIMEEHYGRDMRKGAKGRVSLSNLFG